MLAVAKLVAVVVVHWHLLRDHHIQLPLCATHRAWVDTRPHEDKDQLMIYELAPCFIACIACFIYVCC